MKIRTHLKPSLVALSVATVLGANSHSLMAQEGADDTEVILVKGIRGSLMQSMDLKRESDGVVDGITAEDIGKFPDTNLAESLQRITGVSIDRGNGEGNKVTVRGFGPNFNVVTLNGRQMPAANINATSFSTARSYNFNNIAAEGVSGIQVYKTGRAKNPTGGIGSVINISTFKPFDKPGLVATFGVKGVMDESTTTGDDITPEFSGLYSNTFADDMFGISINANLQERHSAFNDAGANNGWISYTGGLTNADGSQAVPEGDIYSYPITMMYSFNEVERTRTNAQVTLQFRPIDTLTATLDYTYAELEVETDRQELSTWFNDNGAYDSGEWALVAENPDPDGPDVYAPVRFLDTSGVDIGQGSGHFGTTNENKSLGLNIEWLASDNLTLTLDAHDSEAEVLPLNAEDGTNNSLSVVSNNRASTNVDFSRDLPVLTVNSNDGVGIDPSLTLPSGTFHRNAYMKNEITQINFDGKYEFDDGVVASIDFGIGRNKVKVQTAFSNAQDNNWGGVGVPADYEDSTFVFTDIRGRFDQIDGHGDPALTNMILFSQVSAIRDQGEAALRRLGVQTVGGCGEGGFRLCARPNGDWDSEITNEEEMTSYYFQVNLVGDMGEMPFRMTAGLRYEDTNIDTASGNAVPDRIVWTGDNEFDAVQTAEASAQSSGGYDHLLPSIDFALDLNDDMVLRAAYGESITRPNYGQVNGAINGGPITRNTNGLGTGTASSGNPNLKPFQSQNIDVSFEYYYDEGSYASAGYYNKKVRNFITNNTTIEPLFDAHTPVGGERWQEALATGLDPTDSDAIRDYFWSQDYDTVPGVGGLDPTGALNDNGSVQYDATDPLNGTIVGLPDDPLVQYTYSQPINSTQEVTIDGFELQVQHVFGDSGFGGIVNYTTVDSDVGYDIFDILGSQFTVVGLSDSANFVAFYDKDGIQARIAYNWRDKFLLATNDRNNNLNPIFTESYGQWDVSASYTFSGDLDGLVVSLEGINLTDEINKNTGRTSEIVDSVTQTGRRINVGVRYTW